MSKLLLLPILFTILFNPAFAQIPETLDEMEEQLDTDSVFGIKAFMNEVFDSVGVFGKDQTNGFDGFNQDKKDQINNLTDSGVEAGKTSVDLWFKFHEFVVDGVFAGSPIPFDRGIVVLISFVVTTIVVTLLIWTFAKRTWKIALALIAFIAIVLVAGIQFPSI